MVKKIKSPILLAYYPLLLVLVELGVGIGGNYLMVHRVGGSDLPLYIDILLFLLCVFASFPVAWLLAGKVGNGSANQPWVLSYIFSVLFISLLSVYGVLRLWLVYEWDTVVDCCAPIGYVSGGFLLFAGISAMIVILTRSAVIFCRNSRK